MILEGEAHTNFTTAGSSAGKGLVMLGLFPTERAMTWWGKRNSEKEQCSTVHRASPPSPMAQFAFLQNGNDGGTYITQGSQSSSDTCMGDGSP